MSLPRTDPRVLVKPRVRALAPYVFGEQKPGAIKLNTNECGWPPAPELKRILADFAEDRLRLYPDPSCQALRQEAASLYGLANDEVLVGNGSDDCLTVICRAFLDPGDIAAMPWPTYSLYDNLVALQGARVAHCPWAENDGQGGTPGWCLPEDLALCGQRVTFISNPNNPSSTLVPVARLRRLADRLQGVLVVDEAYVDFADAEPASILPFLHEHPNLIVLRTFSKSYSLAGARLGMLFAHRDLVAEMMKVKDTYNVNALTQALGLAALHDQAYHRDLVARTQESRRALEQGLRACGWLWPRPQANFILCEVGSEAESIQRRLKDQGMLVRWWGTAELRGRLRISAGRGEDQARLLDLLLDILGRAG